MDIPISSNLETLEKMRHKSLSAGGPLKIDEQHSRGKLTARERVILLIDEESFEEFDAIKIGRGGALGDNRTYPGDGVITGHGTIDGREVFVFSQDFTVIGGTLGEAHSQKICKVMDLAVKVGAPIIGLNDSG
ncbi:MAG: carboxyl transferase domain-containing protein, partial [Desulfosalsimonadaceae bacterium]